eukprot:TRINITY_DN77522_c0_g1_i1.p1 TRINITY_DN77522_c0_g1~~TRINITY_DN77522_c0_g1_i1.p1  ORF type:complete len:363 (-),score=9.43 TRINITY_DN77522_c0_g1_i1:150-1238(-)
MENLSPVVLFLVLFLLVPIAQCCANLQTTCGAKADGSDDSGSFAVCQRKAGGFGGCIDIPQGNYHVYEVLLATPNIIWRVGTSVTFHPYIPQHVRRIRSIFQLGSKDTNVHNVSFVGLSHNKFTVDTSHALLKSWNVRAFQLFGISNFTLGNFVAKMAYPAGTKSALGFDNSGEFHARYGHVVNITSTGSIHGYGTIQVQSAAHILFENIDGTGGVTLRLETGVGSAGAFVGNIVAKNIIGRDGYAAVMAQPHQQQNGVFHVYNVTCHSCAAAVFLSGGYSRHGKPPGWYSNDSSVQGVVAFWGKDAQLNRTADGDSCVACAIGIVPLNYKVAVSGLTSKYFPPGQRKSTCVYWNRHHPCPY